MSWRGHREVATRGRVLENGGIPRARASASALVILQKVRLFIDNLFYVPTHGVYMYWFLRNKPSVIQNILGKEAKNHKIELRLEKWKVKVFFENLFTPIAPSHETLSAAVPRSSPLSRALPSPRRRLLLLLAPPAPATPRRKLSSLRRRRRASRTLLAPRCITAPPSCHREAGSGGGEVVPA